MRTLQNDADTTSDIFCSCFLCAKQKCLIFSPVIKKNDQSPQEKCKHHQLRNSRNRRAFVCVADTTQNFVEISSFNIISLRNHNRYFTCLNYCYFPSISRTGVYRCKLSNIYCYFRTSIRYSSRAIGKNVQHIMENAIHTN